MNYTELTPGTLEKNGISYAPRTLASLVYMDDGTKASDILKEMLGDGKRFILKTKTEQIEVEYENQRIYNIPAPLENYDYDKYDMIVSLNENIVDASNYVINDTQLILNSDFSANVHTDDVIMLIFHYLDIIIENTGINAESVNNIRYFASKTEPMHKKTNDVWFDTTLNQVKQFNGEEWEIIVSGTGGSGSGGSNTALAVFKNSVIINTSVDSVNIGIPEYKKGEDTLFVYLNSTYLEENQDYVVNSTSTKISTLSGYWNGSEESQVFNFVVLKNVVKAFDGINGNLLINNTITMNKLSTDIIDKLNSIGTDTGTGTLPDSIPASKIEQDHEHRFVTDEMIDILNSYQETIAALNARIKQLEDSAFIVANNV